jgi:transcriptional regulator with XRE-family HTH domain
MNRRTLTLAEVERVRAALRSLVARYPSQVECSRATGIRQQSLSRYGTGADRPGFAFARELAEALGVQVEELLSGERVVGPALLRSLPGWAEAEAEARRRWPYLADQIAAVGRLATTEPPERVTAELLVDLAHAWAKATAPK